MLLSCVTVLVLSLANNAACWGDVGHRTVGYLAYKNLQPSTASYIDGILKDENDYDIGDAATWPDKIKFGRPYTKPWHFIDAKDSPPKSCGLHYPTDCGTEQSEGCIITAISNQTSLFIDTNNDDTTRREALMFILHFIGDLHQPLHVEDAYRGGNEIHVCFARACSKNNLHSVWDTYIPHKICGIPHTSKQNQERIAAQKWADKLYGEQQAKGESVTAECADTNAPDKCSLAWAKESNTYVCKTAMKEGIDWLESNDLSQDYYEEAVPVVEYLISKAGLRLAAWLEAMVAASGQQVKSGQQQVLGDLEL